MGVRLSGENGGEATSSTTVTVLADLVAPTSNVTLLAARQTSRTFPVTVTSSDPAPSSGLFFDIYVAVDNGLLRRVTVTA